MAAGSRSGESSHCRSRRPPIGVTVASIVSSRVQPRAPARSGSTSSRFRRVISSSQRNASLRRTVGRARCGSPDGCSSVRYRSSAPAAPSAGASSGPTPSPSSAREREPPRQLLPREVGIELPALAHRARGPPRRRARRSSGTTTSAGASRPSASASAAAFQGLEHELAGAEVDRREAHPLRPPRTAQPGSCSCPRRASPPAASRPA